MEESVSIATPTIIRTEVPPNACINESPVNQKIMVGTIARTAIKDSTGEGDSVNNSLDIR